MEKDEEKQQHDFKIDQEPYKETTNSPENFTVANDADAGGGGSRGRVERYSRWFQMSFFAIVVVSSQSVATILGRSYFEKGGNSKWLQTLVQSIAFPLLLPVFCFTRDKNVDDDENKNERRKSRSAPLVLGSIYVVLGVLQASCSLLASIGLSYLPVSTSSLISASQLGFNALFSYFINSQKFTPYIINSVVVLTISSVLLVFQLQTDDSSGNGSAKPSRSKYVAGFISTLASSALYSLVLCLTQLAFTKVIKKHTAKAYTEYIVCQTLVAAVIAMIGLFASGEWETLNNEMNEYELGEVSYLMNLLWSAVSWQVFSIGVLGLIVKASSLFANVISTLCLPVVPVLAVIIFKDKMNSVKIISLILAIWGFVSYLYHHYLDDLKLKQAQKIQNVTQVSSEIPLNVGE